MRTSRSNRWDQLGIQKKVLVVLLIVVMPMVAILAVHASLIKSLLETQQLRHRMLLAREQTQELRRLAIDIEDAFRGYLLTREATFLAPLKEAEGKLLDALVRARELLAVLPESAEEVARIGSQIQTLLVSKHELIAKVEQGRLDEALQYVRSGQGLLLSDRVRSQLRTVEDRLDQQVERLERRAVQLSTKAFWGLIAAVGVGLVLGWYAVRQLATSLTGPLETIRASLLAFAQDGDASVLGELKNVASADELGQLARSCEEMSARISENIRELQTLHEVGLEIGRIGPDGIDGVVQQIADRAAALIEVDVCLVLSRNETMGCWVVEAASGEFAERMRKTVMLWQELPLSVQAYETGRPAIGEHLRKDVRPELVRRNLIGDSMLTVPLLSHGASIGVMAFLSERAIPAESWNVRMAESLAGAAAVAITNARLYDAAYQKERQTRQRLRELEHLGESLAHDLKGPAERMGGLAALLRREVNLEGSERGARLLDLIERNGLELGSRIDQLLALARLGGRPQSLEAVDPVTVLDDILKARASELETARVHVTREPGLLPVACHRAYLYQVFDNLISNAVKFTRGVAEPHIVVSGCRDGSRTVFSVADNGPGIPASQRERVFDPFVRLNPSAAEGTGIGLAIVRRIVELYGGRVWVDGRQNSGCCIRFTLPLIGALRELEADRVRITHDGEAGPTAGEGML